MGKRMDDWLVNMSDWNISRRRYYGLPLPFYPCSCGHLEVVGLARRTWPSWPPAPLDDLAGAAPSVDRPRDDPLPRLRRGGRSASPRSATCGSTPASCRSPPSAGRTPTCDRRGLRHGRGQGPHHRRPARPRLLGASGSRPTGCRRCASRSACGSTRSCSCRSRSPARRRIRKVLGYEKMLDEHGPGDARLVGQHDRRRRRVRPHGRRRHALAVLPRSRRPRTCCSASAPATRSSASCSRCGTASTFFIQYANIDGVHPDLRRARHGSRRRPRARSTAGWSRGPACSSPTPPRPTSSTCRSTCCGRSSSSSTTCRTGTCAARADGSGTATQRRCARCGPRSSTSLRVVAPIMPFLTEHLWQNLVAGVLPTRPVRSSSPAGRRRTAVDDDLLGDVAAVRQVVELGRQARRGVEASASASRCAGSSSKAADRAGASRRRDRRRAARQGGHVRTDRGHRAPGAPQPAGARPAVRQGARRSAPPSTRASSSSSTVVASASPGTSWTPDDVLVERTEKAGLGGRRQRRRLGRARHRRSMTTCAARVVSTT